MKRWLLTRLHDSEVWSNYRPHIPPVYFFLALAGGVVVIVSFVLRQNDQNLPANILLVVGILLIIPIAPIAFLVRWMRNYRANLRDLMLDPIFWRGDERVLDIGCGSGMLLNGAAQLLPHGHALGIDIWDAHSGGGNLDILLSNARAEGVAHRIEFKQVDARQMPFEDGRFDVVLSSGAVHHIIRNHDEFEQVMREMARVLKRGGQIVLWDVPHIIEASAARLQQAGIRSEVKPTAPFLGFANSLLIGKKTG